MNYDPSLVCSGKTAKQTVELVFQQWEYSATHRVEVHGNCLGVSILRAALANFADSIFDDNERAEITLTDSKGNTLLVGDEGDSDFLEEILVGARIIAIEPDRT